MIIFNYLYSFISRNTDCSYCAALIVRRGLRHETAWRHILDKNCLVYVP